MEKAYKNLMAWQKADQLAYKIYLSTRSFPREEMYGLTSQLRRAAISIPTNIVEGIGRQNRNEIKQFSNIALGSLREVEYLLEFCFKLEYISREIYEELEAIRTETGALLWKFHKSFSSN